MKEIHEDNGRKCKYSKLVQTPNWLLFCGVMVNKVSQWTYTDILINCVGRQRAVNSQFI